MPRLKASHLPHKVEISRLTGEGADGAIFADFVEAPAYVEQKSKLLIDRRSASSSYNQEVTSDTFIVLLTKDDVLPGSRIKVWAGTPRERVAEVIASAFFEYKRTPSHVEVWTD